jgi:Zn-dependent peptidase ImmA (M78 family)/transcriptional regulator with XRE-family HTH domain
MPRPTNNKNARLAVRTEFMDQGFNGGQLRLARVFHGWALEEVAEQVACTRQYLHKLETGQGAPTTDMTDKLAHALRVEPEFFQLPRLDLAEEQFHFRKLFTTRAMVKQVALARAELFGRLVICFDSLLSLPKVNVPIAEAASVDDIERAAERCRQAWELGLGPIEHTTRLAENVGALVTHFQGVSTEIDALSVAAHRPIIVRNEAKLSTCRQRFDVSHELGHFVLHSGRITGDRITESEANRFAGALLVPRSMMAKLFPRPRGSRLDWVGLREFKMTWKVSKAALLYRARQLDLISDDQYKTGAIMLRRSGEANGEREDSLIPAEQPELLRRSFDVLASRKGMFAEDIAKAMHIGVDLLSDLVGFDPPRRDTPRRPALKLVT